MPVFAFLQMVSKQSCIKLTLLHFHIAYIYNICTANTIEWLYFVYNVGVDGWCGDMLGYGFKVKLFICRFFSIRAIQYD